MKIGFFDSGVGGITVLKRALEMLPHEDYLYYADTLHVPYGTKRKEEVKGYVFKAADFLADRGVKLLVIACNTATSIAIEDLRKKYTFPVIGMEPAVKPALERNVGDGRRVLVLATPLTLKEEKFQNLVSKLDHQHIVDYLPLPELVEYAEAMEFRHYVIEPYLKDKFSDYDLHKYGTFVLGCTHFPFYWKIFRKMLPPHIDIIDGSIGTVKHMKNLLEGKKLFKANNDIIGEVTFYTSENNKYGQEKIGNFHKLLKNYDLY